MLHSYSYHYISSLFLNLVDCEPNPCKQNVSCSDDFTDLWNVTCDCPPGYVGDFCQVNFDECASDPCQNGATCIDHVDYYTCDCASGWEGTKMLLLTVTPPHLFPLKVTNVGGIPC